MKRRAAAALLAFFVAMICFGILSRAVNETTVALVATERLSTQTIDREADDGKAVEYTTCVPLLAVHREGARSFVYVVAEQSGFLGIERIARKVGVTVIDSGKSYVALSDGAISSQQGVIVRSDRVLTDGNKVRVADA